MKKIKIVLDPNVLVKDVEELVSRLSQEKLLPARVERTEEGEDILVITAYGEMTDTQLVELGMFIQSQLNNH